LKKKTLRSLTSTPLLEVSYINIERVRGKKKRRRIRTSHSEGLAKKDSRSYIQPNGKGIMAQELDTLERNVLLRL
jgi:hypothetical protein